MKRLILVVSILLSVNCYAGRFDEALKQAEAETCNPKTYVLTQETLDFISNIIYNSVVKFNARSNRAISIGITCLLMDTD